MKSLKPLAMTMLSLFIGFLASGVFALIIGESPFRLMTILLDGAFGSWTNLGYSLYYATPLIFAGLSVSWAFQSGLFNVGADGQMALGGLVITAVALALKDSNPFLVYSVAFIAAFCASGFWGAMAGWMKSYRGAHEVLVTILLNYVAYAVVSFCVAYPLRNLESQSPQSRDLSLEFKFSNLEFLGGQSPLNTSFLISLISALMMGLVLRHSVFGFRTRMAGQVPGTAERSGFSVKKMTILSMFIAGGLAGLGAMNEILGYSLKLKEGFTFGAGFIGIAVALLGRNSILGIVLSAILFGALQKGALSMDLESEIITRDIAVVIQSFIIFAVVSERGLTIIYEKLKYRWSANG